MMTIQQWIKHFDNARNQYYEGAINEQELFNTVLAAALDVDDGSEPEDKDSSFISNPPDEGGFINILHREETD